MTNYSWESQFDLRWSRDLDWDVYSQKSIRFLQKKWNKATKLDTDYTQEYDII